MTTHTFSAIRFTDEDNLTLVSPATDVSFTFQDLGGTFGYSVFGRTDGLPNIILNDPPQVRQLRVDFWGLALSGANKINGLMVPTCPNIRSLVVARQSKNTHDMKDF
jgi:hypothetical protein